MPTPLQSSICAALAAFVLTTACDAQTANPIEKAEKFLMENKAREGVKTLPSGLQYKVIKDGEGKTPTATDTVVTHYRGTLLDGSEFDSSYKRKQPAEFRVSSLIKGWTEALQLMKEGAKWTLYIPPKLAYGEGGAPPTIGPNETLIFEIELLKVGSPPKPSASVPTASDTAGDKPTGRTGYQTADDAAPSDDLLRELRAVQTAFQDSVDKTAEAVFAVPFSRSRRPVLFQNKIVPQAAKALFEDNEQLKLLKARSANLSPEAGNIDFWVAKFVKDSGSPFWEQRLASAGSPPKPPPSVPSASDAAGDKPTGRTGYQTADDAAPSDDLLKELFEVQIAFRGSTAETLEKLGTLPPAQSLRPVIFRNKIVPQAAKSLYEDNEQLKLLKSPNADYSPAAQDPDYWVRKVAPSVFWESRMKNAAASTRTKAAVGGATKPGGAGSSDPKAPTGQTGYQTKGDRPAAADPAGTANKGDAGAKLSAIGAQKAALEKQRRTLQDRKLQLNLQKAQLSVDEAAIVAETASVNASLDAFNRENDRLNATASQVNRRDGAAVDAYNAKVNKLQEKGPALDATVAGLRARIKAYSEKLAPLEVELKGIDAKTAALTEKINALIKEGIEVQAQMLGNKASPSP